jgi:hypothetical protein
MTHFLARRKTVPVFIINRMPKRRSANADVIGMTISLAFLAAISVAYLYLEGFIP